MLLVFFLFLTWDRSSQHLGQGSFETFRSNVEFDLVSSIRINNNVITVGLIDGAPGYFTFRVVDDELMQLLLGHGVHVS